MSKFKGFAAAMLRLFFSTRAEFKVVFTEYVPSSIIHDLYFFKFLSPFKSFRNVIYEVALDISEVVREWNSNFSSLKGLAKGK